MSSSNSSFIDALNPSSSTARRDTSTVRSRTRRQISFHRDDDDNYNNDDCGDGGFGSSQLRQHSPGATTPCSSRGTTPSPHPSRRISPFPMRNPPRVTELSGRSGQQKRDATSLGGLGLAGNGQLNLAETSRAAIDLLDASWSSLQGLASSVLRSDIGRAASSSRAVKAHTRRKPSRTDAYLRSTPRSSTPSSWGPSGPATPEIGAGTQEERQALLQAKKREALLLADTDTETASGSTSRHKRRDSSERPDQSAVDPEQDEESLVYIHHVQPTDTITGVTIRYGCQAAVFRRANGFWHSDSIQSRKTVLLPVESCSVKGRPLPPADSAGLLNNNRTLNDSLEDLHASSIAPVPVHNSDTLANGETSSNTISESEGDRTWKHESWVQIDGFPAAVEIGRVPRRTLGFFPRTRRKSLTYTDYSESPTISSRDSTIFLSPSESLEAQPSPVILPENRPVLCSSRRTSSSKPGIRHQRHRGSFHFAGPGVGTLDSGAIAPGPAPDKLNQFFAQHIPTLGPPAPPPTNQPRPSFESASTVTSTAPTSLDNLGGVLEGWVRKVATRAKSSINEWQQQHQLTNNRDYVPGFEDGVLGGDLIELDARTYNNNNSSSGGGRGPADAGTRRETSLNRSGSGSSFRHASSSSSSLRERFHSPSSSSATSGTRGSGTKTGLGLGLKND